MTPASAENLRVKQGRADRGERFGATPYGHAPVFFASLPWYGRLRGRKKRRGNHSGSSSSRRIGDPYAQAEPRRFERRNRPVLFLSARKHAESCPSRSSARRSCARKKASLPPHMRRGFPGFRSFLLCCYGLAGVKRSQRTGALCGDARKTSRCLSRVAGQL